MAGRIAAPVPPPVFVDAQHHGTLKAQALLGYALGELVVDALDSGAADVEDAGERGDADARQRTATHGAQ